ncbi:MAG: ThiF family adenylyltransferase [Porcipelethomonas sp.]
MQTEFSRTELILGNDAMKKLSSARVAVFGIGGVGGYTVEALARSGVGNLDIIDDDKICITNINRQIYALRSTLGQYKVDAAKERILDINPECTVREYKMFYTPETSSQFDFSVYDYIVDAIDTVTGKIEIVEQANKCGTPVICSMGAGNKLDPTAFEVTDIYKTSVCPLAKVMRYELRRRGIKKLKVVYSRETPLPPAENLSAECASLTEAEQQSAHRRRIPGSNAFVPSAAGLIIAGEVIKDIIK